MKLFYQLDFSKDIINAVAQLKNKENIIVELKYIKDIIPYDNPML